jgi:hypothetical protein
MFAHHDSHQTLSRRRAAFAARPAEGDDEAEGGDEGRGDTLEDAARDERGYARQRLREELGRDPTEEEIDEWLRRQTEGY